MPHSRHDSYSHSAVRIARRGWGIEHGKYADMRQFGTSLGLLSGVTHGADVWMWHSLIALHHASLNHQLYRSPA